MLWFRGTPILGNLHWAGVIPPEFPRDPPQCLCSRDGGSPVARLHRAASEILDAAEDAGAEISIKSQVSGGLRWSQVQWKWSCHENWPLKNGLGHDLVKNCEIWTWAWFEKTPGWFILGHLATTGTITSKKSGLPEIPLWQLNMAGWNSSIFKHVWSITEWWFSHCCVRLYSWIDLLVISAFHYLGVLFLAFHHLSVLVNTAVYVFCHPKFVWGNWRGSPCLSKACGQLMMTLRFLPASKSLWKGWISLHLQKSEAMVKLFPNISTPRSTCSSGPTGRTPQKFTAVPKAPGSSNTTHPLFGSLPPRAVMVDTAQEWQERSHEVNQFTWKCRFGAHCPCPRLPRPGLLSPLVHLPTAQLCARRGSTHPKCPSHVVWRPRYPQTPEPSPRPPIPGPKSCDPPKWSHSPCRHTPGRWGQWDGVRTFQALGEWDLCHPFKTGVRLQLVLNRTINDNHVCLLGGSSSSIQAVPQKPIVLLVFNGQPVDQTARRSHLLGMKWVHLPHNGNKMEWVSATKPEYSKGDSHQWCLGCECSPGWWSARNLRPAPQPVEPTVLGLVPPIQRTPRLPVLEHPVVAFLEEICIESASKCPSSWLPTSKAKTRLQMPHWSPACPVCPASPDRFLRFDLSVHLALELLEVLTHGSSLHFGAPKHSFLAICSVLPAPQPPEFRDLSSQRATLQPCCPPRICTAFALASALLQLRIQRIPIWGAECDSCGSCDEEAMELVQFQADGLKAASHGTKRSPQLAGPSEFFNDKGTGTARTACLRLPVSFKCLTDCI